MFALGTAAGATIAMWVMPGSPNQASPPRPRLNGRELTSDPCHRFPGNHQFRGSLEHLGHEPLASFALALEIRPVDGSGGFDPGESGFQHLDAGRECRHHRLITLL
jgi:hypothetical protein